MGDDATPPCRRSIPKKPRHLELQSPVERYFLIWQTRSRFHLHEVPTSRASGNIEVIYVLNGFHTRHLLLVSAGEICAALCWAALPRA
jgi:hypothetical protein